MYRDPLSRYQPWPQRKYATRTFYDFEDFVRNPPSRQVRRQCERRQDRMPVTVKVKKGKYGTREMRVA